MDKPIGCTDGRFAAGGRTRSVVLENRVDELLRLRTWARQLLQAWHVDGPGCADWLVAIDEMATNIVMYAYPATEVHTFVVSAHMDAHQLAFVFEDTGMPFDPTQVLRTTTADSPDDAGSLMGGFGLRIVADLMDSMTYARVDGKNRLTISRHNRGITET